MPPYEAAFVGLVHRYQESLLRLALVYARSRAVAEERVLLHRARSRVRRAIERHFDAE